MMKESYTLLLVVGVMVASSMCQEVTESASESERTPRVALGDIAKELISRSTSSQVLSLNLTNLIILLVLKGLLFGATMWGGHGYGGGAYHGKGRMLDDDETTSWISEPELLLITSYLMGDADKNYQCLYRVACEEPKKTKQYLQASKVLLKAGKMFKGVIDYNPKYESLVSNIQEASDFGAKYYGSCGKKYECVNK